MLMEAVQKRTEENGREIEKDKNKMEKTREKTHTHTKYEQT